MFLSALHLAFLLLTMVRVMSLWNSGCNQTGTVRPQQERLSFPESPTLTANTHHGKIHAVRDPHYGRIGISGNLASVAWPLKVLNMAMKKK